MIKRRIVLYSISPGKQPFQEWFESLADTRTKEQILCRLDRVKYGNFGDNRSVGKGVYELRIHHGPGYRVYFGHEGAMIVILLIGGEKSAQRRDIRKAQEYLEDFRRRTK